MNITKKITDLKNKDNKKNNAFNLLTNIKLMAFIPYTQIDYFYNLLKKNLIMIHFLNILTDIILKVKNFLKIYGTIQKLY